jgi:hypothetical protein
MQERPAVTPAQVSAVIAGVCPGWRAVRTWPLAGGASAHVSGVEVERAGGGQLRLVLRQYGSDPLADLAVARLEIGWFFGGEAMDMLTEQYRAGRPEVDISALPVWDLRAAPRACAFPLSTWELPADQLAAMRAAHDEFAATAIRQLAGRRGGENAGTQR